MLYVCTGRVFAQDCKAIIDVIKIGNDVQLVYITTITAWPNAMQQEYCETYLGFQYKVWPRIAKSFKMNHVTIFCM